MQLTDGYLVFSDARYVALRPVLLTGLLLAAAVSDVRRRRIPNRLVAAGVIVAFAWHLIFPLEVGWLHALQGMALGFAMLLPLYLLRGMAAGDVKLMTMVGAFLGPLATFWAVVVTFLFGGLWALLVVVQKRAWSRLLTNFRQLRSSAAAGMEAPSVGRIPYGVVIALGTLFELLVLRSGHWF